MRVRDQFTLQGDYSFDALSPNGRWLYLVEYLSRRDPTRYLVRLYDLERDRLLSEPIIDPQEVGDVMRGMPVTRASSPDGRFAYTLYDGAGKHPFVHALDTVGKTARCIDLHGLMGYEFLSEAQLEVSPDGGTLAVMPPRGSEPLFLIDTETNEVTEPAEPADTQRPQEPQEPQSAAAQDEPDGLPWALLAGAAVVFLTLLIGAGRLLRGVRRRAAPEPIEPLGDLADFDVELPEPLLDDVPDPERPRVPVP